MAPPPPRERPVAAFGDHILILTAKRHWAGFSMKAVRVVCRTSSSRVLVLFDVKKYGKTSSPYFGEEYKAIFYFKIVGRRKASPISIWLF